MRLPQIIFTIFLILFGFGCYSQICNCNVDYEKIKDKIEQNYSGFNTKVPPEKIKEYKDFSSEVEQKSKKICDFDSCTQLLNDWLNYFHDHHLILGVDKPSEYKHPLPPSFQVIDKYTLLLNIPSFEYFFKSAIDSLLKLNHKNIISTPNLIIDIRGNGGGSDASFRNLMAYLYTQPILSYNVEYWASQGNIDYYKQLSRNKDFEEQDRQFFETLADTLSNHINEFVSITPVDTNMTIFDSVYLFPKKVAIIIDKENASSAEEFLLAAKQSKKVILFGKEHTKGALDYSNLYAEYLPSGKRGVFIPTSRSKRIKKKQIDNIGLSPDVVIGFNNEKKIIKFIINYLKK